jgi:hypothetical protein
MSYGECRIEFDGFAIHRDGFTPSLLSMKRSAESMIRYCLSRSDGERGPKETFGFCGPDFHDGRSHEVVQPEVGRKLSLAPAQPGFSVRVTSA